MESRERERKNRASSLLKRLNAPHDITVSTNGREIYVGELATASKNALHKFELTVRKGEKSDLLVVDSRLFFPSLRSSHTNIQ